MYTIKLDAAPKEFKAMAGSLKATNDSQYIVEGILNAIGNVDDGGDMTMPNAFKRTLDAAYSRKSAQGLDFLWPYLWNHDYNIIPPGGIFDADEVKANGSTPAGLFIKVQLNPEYQLARDMYSSYKMGTVRKQSMGYKAVKYDYTDVDGQKNVRRLIEVALMEGSAVVFPMNDLSDVTGVKRLAQFQKKLRTGTLTAKETKDFNDEYRQRRISDWRSALWSWFYALNASIMDAFAQGDDPTGDMQANLNGVDDSPGAIQALMDLIQQGIDLDVSNYLQEQMQDNNPYYGYMSADPEMEAKAGRAISAANAAKLQKHVDAAKEISNKASAIAKDLSMVLNNQQSYASADPSETLSRKTDSDDMSTQVLDGLLASLQKTNHKLTK